MKEKLKSLTAVFYTPVLIYFVLFVVISLVAIAAATPLAHIQYPGQNFIMRQTIFFIVGLVATFLVMLIGMKWLRFLRWPLYIVSTILLLVIFFYGDNSLDNCISRPDMLIPCLNGATRWINLGAFQLQPSEFLRIALILVTADVIQRHNEKYLHKQRTHLTDLWLIIKAIAVAVLPTLLIFQQRDTGITILILITTAFMLVTAGIKWTYIVVVGGGALFIATTFITLVRYNPDFLLSFDFIEAYQLDRFVGWFDPFSELNHRGMQLGRGLLGMGTGGITGHGFRSFAIFFPEAHTDFIFAVIGMDFGMIGSMFVIIVSLLFNFSVLNTAVLNRDHFNSHVCVGIFASLMAQQFWNIGMVLGILPISGVTLPFISHGGSSILASMIMLGLALASHIEGLTIKRNTTIFREDVIYFEEKDTKYSKMGKN